MSDMDDVVKAFLVESYGNLDQLDRDLVALEQDPSAGETLASIFRTIHTIKTPVELEAGSDEQSQRDCLTSAQGHGGDG